METNVLHYLNGNEVHAGDRVRYKGAAANVVFVSDGESGEFLPGYRDYVGYEPGIMLCDDDGEMMFIYDPDENLEFAHRGSA